MDFSRVGPVSRDCRSLSEHLLYFDVYRARLQSVAAWQLQRRVAFLPGVPLTLKALRKKDHSEDRQTLGEHLKKRCRELGLLQREDRQPHGRLGRYRFQLGEVHIQANPVPVHAGGGVPRLMTRCLHLRPWPSASRRSAGSSGPPWTRWRSTSGGMKARCAAISRVNGDCPRSGAGGGAGVVHEPGGREISSGLGEAQEGAVTPGSTSRRLKWMRARRSRVVTDVMPLARHLTSSRPASACGSGVGSRSPAGSGTRFAFSSYRSPNRRPAGVRWEIQLLPLAV